MASPSITRKKATLTPTSYAYQRIETDIREKVRDGRLPAGTMLPSRHNLAKEYGVSLATTQQAIANLIADGTLEASDRRGTFVALRSADSERSVPTTGETGPTFALSPGEDRVLHSAPLPIGGANATLGIVATTRIHPMESSDTGSLWARQAIRSLEQTFSVAGGTIHFFDRFPEEQGPYEQGIDDVNAISMTEAIRSLRADGTAALAIIGLCDDGDWSDEIVAAVDVERVPVVYVSWHEIQPPLAQVYYDNRFAGYQAAQHLLRKGYTNLLYLAPFRLGWLAERIEGARDAVRHAGLPADILRVYPDQPVHEGYSFDFADTWMFEAARQFFAEESVPETGADNPAENILAGLSDEEQWGIIAPNDFTAYAVLRAAAEQGKTMGVDYGLVGFDDDPRSYSLGLTTIRPPIEAMGEEAGRLLLRALHGERSGLQVRLRSQVIPRASTDPSPRASFPERQRALPVRRALQYSNRGMIR